MHVNVKKPRDINSLSPDHTDSGNLLQSILAIKKIWKTFMKFDVIFLTSNDRVAAMKQHFKSEERVKFPIAFMFETSVGYDSDLGLSAKNLARSGTGKGIKIDGNSATIQKSFLLPARITFDFVIFFDNDYDAIKWKERALLYLASSSLGGTLTYKNFVYDLHQAEAVNEISTPQREPDQVPHPDASEFTLSLTFRTKIGRVSDVAKFNNEGLVDLQFSLKSGDSTERIDWQEPVETRQLSRKDIHQAAKGNIR